MDKITKLIKEKCPNGVVFKTIKELAEVGTGSSNRQDESEDGVYPFYVRSKDVHKSNKFLFDETAIIIPGEGGIGDIYHFAQGKYDLHQRAYRIHFIKPEINPRFAYFYFRNSFKSFILRKSVSATVTSIRKPMIEDFTIPVPPLEIQQEIVEILDSFIGLKNELEIELIKRKQQYEYYRDHLLNFERERERESRIKWFPLGEIATILRGKRLTKKELSENGVPVFHGGLEPLGYYHSANRRQNMVMIINVGASAGTVGFCKERFWSSDGCYCLEPKEYIDDKYLYYFLQSKEQRIRGKVRFAGIPTLDTTPLAKISIPVPELSVQKKIVSILDTFEIICSDLSLGLPAEIGARQRQYLYYRNKLLSF